MSQETGTTSTNVGGFGEGGGLGGGTITNCFWDTTTGPSTNTGSGATEKTTAELQSLTVYIYYMGCL